MADCLKNPDDESCKALKWLEDYDLIYDDDSEYMLGTGEIANGEVTHPLNSATDLPNRNSIPDTSTESSTSLVPNASINEKSLNEEEPETILELNSEIQAANHLQMKIDETFNESRSTFPARLITNESELISLSPESPPMSMTSDEDPSSYDEDRLVTESSTSSPPNLEPRIFNPFNKDITNKNKINTLNTHPNDMIFPPPHHLPIFIPPPNNQPPMLHPKYPHVGKYPGTSRPTPKCCYPSYPQMCSYLPPQDDPNDYPIVPSASYPCWNPGNQYPMGLIYMAPPHLPTYY